MERQGGGGETGAAAERRARGGAAFKQGMPPSPGEAWRSCWVRGCSSVSRRQQASSQDGRSERTDCPIRFKQVVADKLECHGQNRILRT